MTIITWEVERFREGNWQAFETHETFKQAAKVYSDRARIAKSPINLRIRECWATEVLAEPTEDQPCVTA